MMQEGDFSHDEVNNLLNDLIDHKKGIDQNNIEV